MGKLAFFFILGLTALVTIEANNPLKEAIAKSNQLLPSVSFVPAPRMLLEDDTYYDTDDMSNEYDYGDVDDEGYGDDVEDIIDDGGDTSNEHDSDDGGDGGDGGNRGTSGGGGNNGNKKNNPGLGCVNVPNMVSLCY